MINVLLADDQPLVRAGIAMLLSAEPDLVVVGEASNGVDTVELALRLQPDVVLMDLRMPGLSGVEATRRLTEEQAGQPDHLIKVLVLTTFDDDTAVFGALRAGASGFLLKYAAPAELAVAVRAVAAGRSYLDPEVAGQVIKALHEMPVAGTAPAEKLLAPLTAREREVLAVVALGLSNAEIGARLYLSEATVKTHVSRILMKTGSRDRAQAVALAYRSGLVQPG